jgi:integrase
VDKTDLYHTEDFKKFLTVQKNHSERTIENHLMNANVFYRSKLSIQDFLINVKNTRTAATYKNYLATLKILYRDYLKKPDMIADFKFPKQQYKPKIIPSKANLKIYYDALPSTREKVIFLLLASSGLRISEALTLKPEEIDFENKMIIPNVHNGQTKQSWITFYNSEVNLREYIPFNISIKRIQVLFKETAVKIGIDISSISESK